MFPVIGPGENIIISPECVRRYAGASGKGDAAGEVGK